MRHKHKTYTPAAPLVTEFATAMTGAVWTLDSSITSDEMAHNILLTNNSAVDHSAKTFEIVYFDEDNRKITETLNMPGASLTVDITNPGYKVESITPSETIGTDTMSLGTKTGTVYSLPIPLEVRYPKTGLGVSVTGTINYSLQHTQSDIQDAEATVVWYDHADASFVDATAGGSTNYDFTPMATRIEVNSFTAGATLTFDIIPANIGS